MIKLLLEAKKLKDRERDGGRSVGDRTLNRLQQRYFEILKDGYKLNPEPNVMAELETGLGVRFERGAFRGGHFLLLLPHQFFSSFSSPQSWWTAAAFR